MKWFLTTIVESAIMSVASFAGTVCGAYLWAGSATWNRKHP